MICLLFAISRLLFFVVMFFVRVRVYASIKNKKACKDTTKIAHTQTFLMNNE